MTTRCQCVSPACVTAHEGELECRAEATRTVRSRDFDEGAYAFCGWCAIAARASGLFEEAVR